VSIVVLVSGFEQSDGTRELIEKEWIESRVARRITNFIASTEEDGTQIGIMMKRKEGQMRVN